jgi:hypothetical protein
VHIAQEKIDALVAQVFEQAAPAAHLDAGAHPRVGAMQLGQQRSQQHGGGMGAAADHQIAHRAAAQVFQFHREVVRGAEQVAGAFERAAPGGGQAHETLAAVEQGHAGEMFQRLDAAREGGLREAGAPRGAAEIEFLGKQDQMLQVFQVHSGFRRWGDRATFRMR